MANRRLDSERKAERRAWLAKFKMDRGCEICGYCKHPAALHFDHLDRDLKRAQISHMVNQSWEKIRAEVAKCRILCSNCHAIETLEQIRSPSWYKPDPRQGYLRLGDLQ